MILDGTKASRRPMGELVSWLPVGLIPIGNGVLRMLTYQAVLGEPWSSLLSSTLDVAAVVIYAMWLHNRAPHPRPGLRGLMWLTASTLSHFVLGLWVFGLTLAELLSKYAVAQGETWLLISAAIGAAPVVAAKLNSRSARDLSDRR